ncbi:hypothetical protein [Acrocarpospora sp. B8E8]|uniref:zinc finger domain-containing protein n=1 Tax=Acrocarpospora sp. B8E8 TaxID=3153572 RepID=UPI00325F3DE8
MKRDITMTRDQIIDILTCAAAYDRRTIGETDIAAWRLAIGDLPFADAQTAVVEHYTDSTDWLMPAHIRTRVKRTRELRLAARPIPAPAPELTHDQAAYQQQFNAIVKRLADGMDPQRAIPAPGHGSAPTSTYIQARGTYRSPHRIVAMQVPCPWGTCRALPGEGCRTTAGHPLDHPHEGRLVEAGLAEWVEVNGVQRAVLHGTERP